MVFHHLRTSSSPFLLTSLNLTCVFLFHCKSHLDRWMIIHKEWASYSCVYNKIVIHSASRGKKCLLHCIANMTAANTKYATPNKPESKECCLQRFQLKTQFLMFGVDIYNDVQKTHSRNLKYKSQDQISLAIIVL